MMDGIITKGIGGFYYVDTDEGIIQCRARGVFRENNIIPLVGDRVRISISSEDGNGYVQEIYERSSQLLRPPVANVTQAIFVASVVNPSINTWLLDKMILMAEHQNLEVIVCINKYDLDKEESEKLLSIYTKAGFITVLTSTKTGLGLEEFKALLKGHISVIAGPSGAGKSSIINLLDPLFDMETGIVSRKTARGKHTTRHIELLTLDKNSYVLDTPGFSTLSLDFIEEDSDLRYYFRDINKYTGDCKFQSCLHESEPGCKVKEAVESGEIDKIRYKNYLMILDDIKKRRRY